jgi:diguanylate cyclase (GGDEF)-like protein
MGSIERGDGESADSPSRSALALRFRQWALWSLPPAPRAFLLTVDVAAVAVVVLSLATGAQTGSVLPTWGLLLALALAQSEMSRAIERARRRFAGALHVNMTSVWVFAGALLLPIGWVGLLVIAMYLHLRVRSWYRIQGVLPYRMIAAAAAMVLSGAAAKAVLAWGGVPDISAVGGHDMAFGVVLLAALAFFVTDAAIIALAAKLVQPDNRLGEVVGSWYDNALELATICLGAMTAIMIDYQPVSVVLVFVPLFVLHRSVLVKQLEETASKDQKTGLLNATAWHALAEKELDRAKRNNGTMGVLMVDLDHFKRVNDTYGHVAGDEVLKATAKLLKAEVRGYDSSGRFGGEEFAVLLPGVSVDEAVEVAERIRQKIALLVVEAPVEDGATTTITDLSGSIGVAVYPNSGDTIQQLLLTADGALYTAKNSGRNRVVSLAT